MVPMVIKDIGSVIIVMHKLHIGKKNDFGHFPKMQGMDMPDIKIMNLSIVSDQCTGSFGNLLKAWD